MSNIFTYLLFSQATRKFPFYSVSDCFRFLFLCLWFVKCWFCVCNVSVNIMYAYVSYILYIMDF